MRLLYTPPGDEAETVAERITPHQAGSSEAIETHPKPEIRSEILTRSHLEVRCEDHPETRSELVMVNSLPAWHQALQDVRETGVCGLDLETLGLDPLVSRIRLVQIAVPGKVYVADVFSLGDSILDDLANLMEDDHVEKVILNAKFELAMIQASQIRRLDVKNVFCTMLASQVNWSGYYTLVPAPKAKKSPWKRDSVEHSLRSLARRHLGIEMDKSFQISDWGSEALSSEQIEYAAKDAEVLLPLHNILSGLLKKNRLERIADLEFRALPAVVEIELAGLPIDTQAALALMEAKSLQAKKLVQELQYEALNNGFKPRTKKGKKPQRLLNPDSLLDVLEYIQHQGQIAISTSEEDLRALKFSWTDRLLRYRRVSRQKKFLEDWLLKVSPVDGRLHAQYFQCSTVSGRFSSRGPNAMRELFRAPAGRKLVKADFSGIELRIMACISKDPTMIAAFQEGQDLHRLTASRIAGIPLEDVTKDQRQAAKGANFGLVYGASASRFQATAKEDYGTDMSLEEAERIRRAFFTAYPGIARWHQVQRTLKRVPFNHYFHDAQHGLYSRILVSSRTVIGRKRVWGWLNGSTLAKETELYNSPCQGTGADLIKIVMGELYARLISEGLEDVKMVGTIHDELILEAPEAQSGERQTCLKRS